MVLPFVRELIAELEQSDAFARVRLHLGAGTGRRRVSGLTATARALYLPYFGRAGQAPALVLVADNKAAETLHAAVQAACELTGALPVESVLRFPAHDVLPFENLSPHPEIQEMRAATLWKIATGAAQMVIAPVESACMRLFAADYYAGLTLRLRRGEEYMPEMLMEHLLSVGYTRVDVVEMPGQVTVRGGIMDVYSPEMDRPVRIDFFGDEIESIRKYEPETQRSSTPLDEALLLPLTETPVTEKLLAAVHARLTKQGIAASEEGEDPQAAEGFDELPDEVSVFPGWEFFAPVAGARASLFDLMASQGRKPRVFVEEPAMVKNQGERWWNKVEQRHERAGIGSLIRPGDIYFTPWDVEEKLRELPGCDLDQLGTVDVFDADTNSLSEVEFATRPTPRFHGSIPALVEQLKTLMAQDARILLTAPHQGEVERLASMLQEYQVPYRLGSRAVHAGSETIYDESSYLAGDMRTPVIVKTPMANGVQVLDIEKTTARQLVIFGAQDLADDIDVAARPVARRSKTSAFLSDFRDLAVGDYVVHVEHGIAQYMGLREIAQDGTDIEFMILEFAEQARL